MATEKELTDAKLEAVEARTDTKVVRLEGKIDLLISKLDGAAMSLKRDLGNLHEDLRETNRRVAGTARIVWSGVATIAALIVVLVMLLVAVFPIFFDMGSRLRDMVMRETLILSPAGPTAVPPAAEQPQQQQPQQKQ